ncbi:SPOR domain-containing protein [Segatella hominis]|uniref:SPOR domain-containing protein n=2 Tax=Segatella hominis TaxID=2518605 RepID=A0A4Y8V5H2_9BACT|nr:SPOR domain-containing protein [Segatella hominis]
MAHHVDARYDGRDNMFLPPLRTVGFNPQLKMNDSLLAQSYVEAYDISYPEAIDRLANEVAEIRQRLENEGKYEINNIGTIYLNEDGNYTFEPCEAGILTPNYYGLGGFDMLPLSAQENEPTVTLEKTNSTNIAENIEINQEEKQAEPVVALQNATANSVFDVNDDDEKPSAEFILIKKSWLRNLAAACIAIIAFFAISTPLRTPNVQTSKIDTGMLTRIMPKELVTQNTHQTELASKTENSEKVLKINSETNKDANDEANEKKIDQAELKSAKPYYGIVLASRVTKRNAANYVETLQAKGFKAAKVVITATNVKVVYGSYETEGQAYKALHDLRNNEVFADGWITKVTE